MATRRPRRLLGTARLVFGNSPSCQWQQAMCAQDAEYGRAVAVRVGSVGAHRLHAARIQLLDLYAPYGSGNHV
ncbi:hypothetical protein [Streptomyces glaucescens]|uniref:hypothetical protein n=1 Tax=Streptomyces glaucescens TaxID=1907 RepID=UPI003F57B5A6